MTMMPQKISGDVRLIKKLVSMRTQESTTIWKFERMKKSISQIDILKRLGRVFTSYQSFSINTQQTPNQHR